MNATDMSKNSATDWERVDALADDAIDTSDIPPLSDSFFAQARLRTPDATVAVTVHIDPDTLDWFKAQGDEYEQRINAALRLYAEVHKAYSRSE